MFTKPKLFWSVAVSVTVFQLVCAYLGILGMYISGTGVLPLAVLVYGCIGLAWAMLVTTIFRD